MEELERRVACEYILRHADVINLATFSSSPLSLPPFLPPYLLESVQPKSLRHRLEEGNLHPRHLGRKEEREEGREGGRDVSKKVLMRGER